MGALMTSFLNWRKTERAAVCIRISMIVIVALFVLLPLLLLAQQTVPSKPAPNSNVPPAVYPPSANAPAATTPDDVEWTCVMHRDYRAKGPGHCPICGMPLIPAIADEREYPVNLTTKPHVLKPGENVQADFLIEDPTTLKTVKDFTIMHEKLYHLFLVSQDMKFFEHVHPVQQPAGTFSWTRHSRTRACIGC